MSADPQIGDVLGGTYRLVRLLGEGGMGAVYEAEHVRLPRRFAVKFLRAEGLRNPQVFQRFRREAEIASSIGQAWDIRYILRRVARRLAYIAKREASAA